MSAEAVAYVLRAVEEQDTPFFFELFCENRRDDFSPLGLAPEALEPLLAMQFRARNVGYAGQFPQAKSWVVSVDGQPVGLVMVDYGDEVMHLVDIAVSRAMQRRGLGTRVMAGLIEEAQSKRVALRLSVRFDNPAIRLYERLGLVRTGGDGLNVAMEMRPGKIQPAEEDEVVPVEEESGVSEELSSRWFRRLVGQRLAARSEERVEVELSLMAVTALPPYRADQGIEMGDSFSLEFHGPMTPVLPPAMTLVTTGAGDEASLFLSPTGPRDGGIQYEAVFNRMRSVTVSPS